MTVEMISAVNVVMVLNNRVVEMEMVVTEIVTLEPKPSKIENEASESSCTETFLSCRFLLPDKSSHVLQIFS